MSADVQCPAGCGPMEYKTNRNMAIRTFDPLGNILMLGGAILIVSSMELGTGIGDDSKFLFGLLLFIPGFYRSSLVTTDLSCNTCTGVILESKSIDQKLKGDAFGLALNKAKYVREALSSSTEDSEHDCPDCGEKMSHIKVPIERERGVYEDKLLVPDIIEDLTNVSDTVKLDGCKECDLLWFKNAKREQRFSGDGTIIPKS